MFFIFFKLGSQYCIVIFVSENQAGDSESNSNTGTQDFEDIIDRMYIYDQRKRKSIIDKLRRMCRVISIKSVLEDKILDGFNIRNLIICLKG